MKATWLAVLAPFAVNAAPWSFTSPVDAVEPVNGLHYHHLDGSGRKHLAVSGGHLALVWEDDSDGNPRVYAAIKGLDETHFTQKFPLSSGGESYEPAVVSEGNGRWLAAWEQDGEIVASVFDLKGALAPTKLSAAEGRQVTLAADDKGSVTAVWAQREGRNQILVASDLVIVDSKVRAAERVPVSMQGASNHQGFPATTRVNDDSLFVAWEDRRAGHTRIFGSLRDARGQFGSESQLNEHNEPEASESWLVNKGTGAMRVSVAANPDGHVMALWLDKRSPGSGYAVWGARSNDRGNTFGPNVRIQDTLGDAVAQWHASVASSPGEFVAVWDDARENWSDENEAGDVFLSWQTPGGWSDDLIVPGASGPGYQGSPVATVDPSGQLHLVWIERDALDAPTRLRYLRGVPES